jgi:hypothetical protein
MTILAPDPGRSEFVSPRRRLIWPTTRQIRSIDRHAAPCAGSRPKEIACAKSKFTSRFKLIWVVQSLQKNNSLLFFPKSVISSLDSAST